MTLKGFWFRGQGHPLITEKFRDPVALESMK